MGREGFREASEKKCGMVWYWRALACMEVWYWAREGGGLFQDDCTTNSQGKRAGEWYSMCLYSHQISNQINLNTSTEGISFGKEKISFLENIYTLNKGQ